ncbi:src substrate cortactin-like [Cervus elaphus]|uniref:src substrate cortactin-like n=1 Tax=Cervus elaphus TaxID=9860 RepID=UPI001CC32612|nr:src substrate cortactin-like [Cervus elaphus]
METKRRFLRISAGGFARGGSAGEAFPAWGQRCGKPRPATLFPSPRTTGEPTTGRTDRDFVNDVSEKEQRWGAKAVPLSGHQEHINIHKLRENVFQEHKTLREKELEMGPKASHSYGRKFGVEQDRMDKSAVGLEYQSKLSKCCLQVDSIWGFGGKFGVQLARVDQSLLMSMESVMPPDHLILCCLLHLDRTEHLPTKKLFQNQKGQL